MPTMRKIEPPLDDQVPAPSSTVHRPSSTDEEAPLITLAELDRLAAWQPGPDAGGVFRRPPGMLEQAEVDSDQLVRGRFQPRTTFDDTGMQELIASIRAHGILTRLKVFVNEQGAFELIAGERRWRAARQLGLALVPVEVGEYTLAQIHEISIIDNLQREGLTPVEEGRAYERMLNELQVSEAELSRRIGKPRSYIQQRRQLATATPEIAAALADAQISFTQARGICAGAGGDADAQRAALAQIRKEAQWRTPTEADARGYAEKYIRDRAEEALKALGWQIHHIHIGSRNAAFVWGGGECPAEWTSAQMLAAVAEQRRPAEGEPPPKRKLSAAEDSAFQRRGWEIGSYPFDGWLLARLGGKSKVLHPDEVAEVVEQARRDLDALKQRFTKQRWRLSWEAGSWWKATSEQGRKAEDHGYAKAEQLLKQIEAGKIDASPPPAKEHCASCGAGLYTYDDWSWHQQQKLCKKCHAVALRAEAEERAQLRAALPTGCLRLIPDELVYWLCRGHQHTDRVLSGRRQSDEWIADALEALSREQREETLLTALAWSMWEQRHAPAGYAPDAGDEQAIAVGEEGSQA